MCGRAPDLTLHAVCQDAYARSFGADEAFAPATPDLAVESVEALTVVVRERATFADIGRAVPLAPVELLKVPIA